jgi:glycosyltransferase involved in cell wall biosynthesis
MFWEPFRYFRVEPGRFDVIHSHAFHAGFCGAACPLVVSNAVQVTALYEDVRGYGPARMGLASRLDRMLALATSVNHATFGGAGVTRYIAFTDYLKRWLVERSIAEPEDVDVVPIYLGDDAPASEASAGHRVGFVAKDFEAKGGPLVLRAFELARRAIPGLELVIVGCEPRMTEAEQAAGGVTWRAYLDREELLDRWMPSFGMMAYPTRFDGLPLVVLEAMARGVPVITSSYRAMPEIVGGDGAGRVLQSDDPRELADRMIELADPAVRAVSSRRTRKHFETHYTRSVVSPKLKASYERAIADA